jgi:hypothetical protein
MFQDPVQPKPSTEEHTKKSGEDLSFLDDPVFRSTVDARVEMLLVQALAGGPITMKPVDADPRR